MSEETKLILSELQALKNEMTGLSHRMDSMEKSLNHRMDGMNQRIDNLESCLSERIDAVQKETTRTRLLLENEYSRKIDVIGEGHDFLKRSLKKALQMERKREKMELDILNLQIDMKEVKTYLCLN